MIATVPASRDLVAGLSPRLRPIDLSEIETLARLPTVWPNRSTARRRAK